MAKQYIQGITKDFCLDFKQKQNELLVEYRAEIDSLYQTMHYRPRKNR